MAGHCRDRPTPPQHAWRIRKPHRALGLVFCVSLSYTLQRALLTWYMRSRPNLGLGGVSSTRPKARAGRLLPRRNPNTDAAGRRSPQAFESYCASRHFRCTQGTSWARKLMANQGGFAQRFVPNHGRGSLLRKIQQPSIGRGAERSLGEKFSHLAEFFKRAKLNSSSQSADQRVSGRNDTDLARPRARC